MPAWLITVLLLLGSNIFMTWAWYGHLKKTGWTIAAAIAISWLIALPEYILQVPANRIGHFSHGGPFTAAQLKVIQEAITLTVFTVFAVLILKEKLRWNEIAAFALIFAAVCIAMIGRGEEPEEAASPEMETPPTFSIPALEERQDQPADSQNPTPAGR